ncbi:MAG: glycosyltransferase [Cyanobacteriota/Melainabacteria group bacterium]
MSKISVVIPAYNEEARLPATLASVFDYLEKKGSDFEILVVDDGSVDGTADFLAKERFSKPSKSTKRARSGNDLWSEPGQGLCGQNRYVLAATGDYIVYNDADGSSPIEEIEKLIASMDAGSDTSFWIAFATDEALCRAWPYRKYMGNTFNLIV